jgi:HSP20 family protein
MTFSERICYRISLMIIRQEYAVPAVNIIEGKDDFRIEVAAPGLDKKGFSRLMLKTMCCFISSEKRQEEEKKVKR